MASQVGGQRRHVNFSRPQRTPSVKSVQSEASTVNSQAMSVRSQAPSVISYAPSTRSQAPSLKSTTSARTDKSSVSTIRNVFSRFSSRSSVTPSISESEQDEPYRPAKAKFVQYHVTSDDISTPSAQRRPQPNRIPTMDQRALPPTIPERTTSLAVEQAGHRKTQTWPPSTRERRAGSFKFDTAPTLTRTPWEIDRGRPGSRWSRSTDRTQNQPRKIFVQLPREIYQCVLDNLEASHTQHETLDVLALRRDLRSLCLVDKRWSGIAKEHMFRELWLPTNKASAKRRFSTRQPKSRLKVLVETLRKTSGLGFLVHHIRVGAELAQELDAEAFAPFKKDSALDSLQLIIRDCYNLEHLSGFVLPATESTTPVLEALASRIRLKSHAWSLDSTRALPGLEYFIFCHDDWVNLETLAIAADPGVDLGIGTISAVLHRLHSLKHLAIFGLHRSDFHNSSLVTLPPVKSLRLECLSGLTDQGVEQLAFSRLALSLERLTLVGLEILSLQTIQTLLSHLTRLKRFAILQESSPEPPDGITSAGRMIALSSPSLQHIHWDCLIPGEALSYLATAISNNKFPRLASAKVPCDYDGVIQQLCRPVPREKLTTQDLEYLHERTSGRYERNLRVSQIQAQVRVRESRQQPSFNVVVEDEHELKATHTIGSYLGSMESKIEYQLDAEVGPNALPEFDDIAQPVQMGIEGRRVERRLEAAMLF
ncbi:putative leucine-rich repeat domain superfamily [Septoria linicola]|nr:putative leucine-rich repeat domain superfamily [Septoria linicola]